MLKVIIVLLGLVIGIVIFSGIGTSITGLATGLNNLSSNFSGMVFFNYTGNFNQSLNTSDSVTFDNANITTNLTIGWSILPISNEGSDLGTNYDHFGRSFTRELMVDHLYGNPETSPNSVLIGGENPFGLTDWVEFNHGVLNVAPFDDNAVNLGADGQRYKNLYLAGQIIANNSFDTIVFKVNPTTQETFTINLLTNESTNLSDTLLVNETSKTVSIKDKLDVRGLTNLSDSLWFNGNIYINGSGIDVTHLIKVEDGKSANGDLLQIQAGKGGANPSGDGYYGGSLYFFSGDGGSSVGALYSGGSAGDLIATAGRGGAGVSGAGGGAGGSLTWTAGNGGTSSGGQAGPGGSVDIGGGNAGTSGSAAPGGNIYLHPGLGRLTGPNGNVLLARSIGSNVGGVGIRIDPPTAALEVGALTSRDTARFQGNVSIYGTGSNLTVTGKVAINSQLHVNYSLNVKGNANATAFVTNGSDYSEVVIKLNAKENITSGNVIAIVSGGKATKNASGSGLSYHVVSTKAGILDGDMDLWENKIVKTNRTYINETTNESYVVEESETIAVQKTDYTNSRYVPVAFIGQVKVKVSGYCNAGDWVLYDGSGLGNCANFGTTNTVSGIVDRIQRKVCTAWESGAGSILCAITGV